MKHNKEMMLKNKILSLEDPKVFEVPVVQHVGKPAIVCVAQNDRVLRGQLIAKAVGRISSNIYSPISGKVLGIYEKTISDGRTCEHVVIQNDLLYEEVFLPEIKQFSQQNVLIRILDAGIVGMSGSGYSTFAKLIPALGKRIETIVINCAECEEDIFSDSAILREHANQIVDGSKYLAIASGAKRIIFAIQKTKKQEISAIKNAIETSIVSAIRITPEIVFISEKYPIGAERLLLKDILNVTVRTGEYPIAYGICVNNPQTANAVFEAVCLNKPLFERVVTICGTAVAKPGIYLVKNGVRFEHIDEMLNKKDKPVSKIIINGLITGSSQMCGANVTTKVVSSINFKTIEKTRKQKEMVCISCGKCAEVCPMRLVPDMLDVAVINDDASLCKKLGLYECNLCGCCSYVCPSRRKMVQRFSTSKVLINERQENK